jgi:hypothetical protein
METIQARTISEREAAATAEDADIFGYPPVLMEIGTGLNTPVPAPTGNRAPMGQFRHRRELPDASHTDLVSPNTGTPHNFAIVGPKCRVTPPASVKELHSPTEMVWII